MNKTNAIIIAVVIVVFVAGVFLWIQRGVPLPFLEKESLSVQEELGPVSLTQEELETLKKEGLSIPSGADSKTEDLKSVTSSDELGAIESDTNETDLFGLDSESGEIDRNLSF